MPIADLVAHLRCAGCGAGRRLLCDECAGSLPEAPADPNYPGIARVVARWDYTGAARRLILDLKVGRRRPAAEALARGIYEQMARRGSRAQVLTWVPARRRDIRDRGFDHAEVIARHLSRWSGLPCVPLLRRTSQRVSDQVGLSRTDRTANLVGAFRARPCADIVGLVDDLATTGATAHSCSRALLSRGAREVELLVACRV